MNSGLVFDVQRFSLGNGPGIRTTIFMKGCPLRCKWCHNPEAFIMESQISLNRKLCRQCEICATKCMNNVHVFDERGHHIHTEKCVKCMKCVEACCYGCLALMGKKYTVEELTEIIMADRKYFGHTGGGVTFSGGEPMLQFKFIEAMIDSIEGIHIALDTSGYCDSNTFANILKQIDLVLFDLKHMDSEQHKRFTGVDNKLILKNFQIAVQSGVALKIRYPMVVDLNDSDENIVSMTDLLKDAGINSIDVSVYHDYGIVKYRDLGLSPTSFRQYSETQQNERIEFIKRCGITPVIV